MRYQWYDPLYEASGGEPDAICWIMAQELVDQTYVGKDKLDL